MARKFELRAYDDRFQLLSQIELDNVTSPSGLGFKQEFTTVDSNTMEYLIHSKIKKQNIKLTVNYIEPNSYYQARKLRAWILQYSKNRTVLVYNDDEERIYYPKSVIMCDCKIEQMDITEIEAAVNSVPLQIKPLTPWYTLGSSIIRQEMIQNGKKYNFQYPYAYGIAIINNENKDIVNEFYDEIPLQIKIVGKWNAPRITLYTGEDQANTYSILNLPNVNLREGEEINVNAIDRTITLKDVNGEIRDCYDQVSKDSDTFLYAKIGNSKVGSNVPNDVNSNGTRPYVEIKYMKYIL